MRSLIVVVVVLLLSVFDLAFGVTTRPAFVSVTNCPSSRRHDHLTGSRCSATVTPFQITVDLPPAGSELQANMKIEPVLSVPSEIIQVRYKLPFDLSVEPKKGLAVCTADGPGGERVNDVLRYTSQWTMGLPRSVGIMATAASFAGGLSWQCSMFDVMKAVKWEQVVEALTSNRPERTDEVVLLFERPLEGTAPELL